MVSPNKRCASPAADRGKRVALDPAEQMAAVIKQRISFAKCTQEDVDSFVQGYYGSYVCNPERFARLAGDELPMTDKNIALIAAGAMIIVKSDRGLT